MIFKFDILFRKVLDDGRIKVVTYSSLLEDSNVFGGNENLENVIGELSVVKEGTENGFSLNSLLCRHHSQLVGRSNADKWKKEIPLRFSFSDSNDVASIKAEVVDESGVIYSSKFETLMIEREKVLDISDMDSFMIAIAQDGDIELVDEYGSELVIKQGEAAYITASTRNISISADKANIIILTAK